MKEELEKQIARAIAQGNVRVLAHLQGIQARQRQDESKDIQLGRANGAKAL